MQAIICILMQQKIEDNMIYGIIDLGSNTLRLSIYEIDPKRSDRFVQLVNKKTMASLASYLDEDSNLSQEGITKAIEILKNYQRKIANFPGAKTYVFATAVLRRAANAQEVMREIKKACGLEIDLLSGEDEARYGFRGALVLLDLEEGAQLDIGGASTELVIYKNKKVKELYSLNIGSLSLYLDHVSAIVPTPREMDDIREHVKAELKTTAKLKAQNIVNLSGVGGSIRAASKIAQAWYPNSKFKQDSFVELSDIDKILSAVSYDPHASTKALLQVVPERIHTAIPGIICAQTIAEFFSAKQLFISKYGVREGYLLSKAVKN